MAIQKTITLDDFVFNQYLQDYVGNNFSKHIQKLIILGSESLSSNIVEQKRRLMHTLEENEKLRSELKIVKMQLAKKKTGDELTKEDIILKRGLKQEHLDFIESAKKKIAENPDCAEGQFNWLSNYFNITSMRYKEFKKLIELEEAVENEN